MSGSTIRSLFPAEDALWVILFPFHKVVFAPHYDWEVRIEHSYPLLRPISWLEVAKGVGFSSLNQVAKGVLELEEPFTTELQEYCEWKKIAFPDYAADRFPVEVLIPLLQFSQKQGSKKLQTLQLARFFDSESKTIPLENRAVFEICREIREAKALKADIGLQLLLPDHDCPYGILAGPQDLCAKAKESCGFEGIQVNPKMRFDWWNQGGI